MECVMLIGIQGSGKSAFFKARFADTHVRINRDMLKTRPREARFFALCLETGQRCVVDNTNATAEERARFIVAARQHGFRVLGYFFEVPVAEAIARNAARAQEQRIPVVGIYATAKRLQRPACAEGFDELFRVQVSAGRFDVEPFPLVE
jgi:predicted kinase